MDKYTKVFYDDGSVAVYKNGNVFLVGDALAVQITLERDYPDVAFGHFEIIEI